MIKLAIISLGNNLGDWELIFDSALDKIQEFGSLDLVSQVYKTEPWGVKDQPWFKNQIVGLFTELSASNLLTYLLEIESELGRNREIEKRWGPRKLDLDIIFYGNDIISEDTLIVPHPRMHERNFILQPLTDIYPNMDHPILNTPVSNLLLECNDTTLIEKITNAL